MAFGRVDLNKGRSIARAALRDGPLCEDGHPVRTRHPVRMSTL
jgi:hypothetical protein